MGSMEKYLHDGERVLYSMSKRTILGRDELAATNSRVILVKGGKCSDISYEFLTSVENARITDWKWGKRAGYASLLSLSLIGALRVLPSLIIQFTSDLSDMINSDVKASITGSLPQGNGQSNLSIGIGASQFDMSTWITSTIPAFDFSGPASSISQAVAGNLELIMYISIAAVVIFLAIFLMQVKRGIELRTPGYTHTFYYRKKQEKQSLEFIMAVRAVRAKRVFEAGGNRNEYKFSLKYDTMR